MRKIRICGIAACLLVLETGCVKPFETAPSASETSYLVVDGPLLPDTNTMIRLSRTRALEDTAGAVLENDAALSIESESGETYPLVPAGSGTYRATNNSLIVGNKYRLKILAKGKQYLSDYVVMQATPPIDSVQWVQNDDIYIYVNAHDPSNNTKYYRWDFVETFNYHAAYESLLDYQNGEVVVLDSTQYRSICYHTFNSTNILVASSAALSSDVISHQLINRIPNDNSKISDRYSILVKQYALTADAYQYWNILRQNSEETGGLFDPQPSQLRSNIHCVDVPDEPVMGYFSASSVQEKRIFILNSQLKDRREPVLDEVCKETFVSRDSAAYYLNDGIFLPAYYVTNGPLAIAPKLCVDCRLRGGVTQKPDFW